MMKNLRKEGFVIGRYRVRQLMKQLNLVVTQRLAYKVTTQRRHSDAVADNLLNMNFNPVASVHDIFHEALLSQGLKKSDNIFINSSTHVSI